MRFLLLLLSLLLAAECRPFKILMFTPRFAHSHTTYMGKIADALVEAGHDVTVFLPEISKNVRTNGTKLAKTITMPPADRVVKQFEGDAYFVDVWTASSTNPIVQQHLMSFVADTMAMQCEELVKQDEIFERFRRERFDLGIVEVFDMCGLGFFEAIGVKKTIVTSSTVLFDGMARALGVPSPPSFVPCSFSTSGESMTFFERLSNMFSLNFVGYMFHDRTKNLEQKYFQDKFGPEFPDFDELIARASIALVNSEPIIDFARPTLNKVIYIGGIGVPTPQPLNEFWTQVMDKREKVVLISFGSFAQSYVMPMKMKEALKEAMRRFPDVTFIWKYENEDDDIGRGVPNLVAKAWVPQADLLNHPNLKAFVTHAGMNSIIEASHRGVPLVTIPLFGEQLRNAKMTKKLGISVSVEKEKLFDSNALEGAIRSILNDETYQTTAKRVAKMIAKRPIPIKQSLVRHVEFAAEFGEMPTFDPMGRKLSWIAYFSLDIMAAVAVSLLSLGLTFLVIVVKIFQLVSSKKYKAE
uniref:glucuronosyltransferase n=1 Tax=Steinernema glaseri TaxID=37863 RepID=A0A1I8ADQ4_9BILA